MIDIYPFRAVMPAAGRAAQIACEPYDVVSTAEARVKAAGNELSFLRVVRPEIDFPEDFDPYSEAVYKRGGENLRSLLDSGDMLETDEPGLFVYRQAMRGWEQTGLVCCYDVRQYRDQTIKKHEKTRPDKEDDRTRHMLVCSAHAEPVFLMFPDQPRIVELIAADCRTSSIIDFVASDGVRHIVWRAAEHRAYIEAFRRVPSLYIADGHHRTAAGERAARQCETENATHRGDEEYNRVLSVMFPASQLRILAYNRVVADLNGMTAEEFVKRISNCGQVENGTDAEPAQQGVFCFYVGGEWHRFTIPAAWREAADPVESLDVALLQSRILEPILAVGNPRTDQRIGFVGGIRGTAELERLVDAGSQAVAFSMFPTSISQLIAVSDAGQIMPPKSTWFEPKLRSGLFVHRF